MVSRIMLVIVTKVWVNALGIDQAFSEASDSRCAGRSHDETNAEYSE